VERKNLTQFVGRRQHTEETM